MKEKNNRFLRSPSDAQKKKRRIIILVCVLTSLLLLLTAAGLYVWHLYESTEDDGRIFSNVYFYDMNLGGMTPEEAQNALQTQVLPLLEQNVTVQLPDASLVFTPKDVNLSLDVAGIVNDAYSYGREGDRWQQARARAAAALTSYELNLLDYMTLNTDYIKRVLNGQNALIASTLSQPTFVLQGDRPQLPEDLKDDTVKHQILLVTLGTPERYLDVDSVYNDVLDAYNTLNFKTITADYFFQAPDEPDLEKAFTEFCENAVNATLDPKTFDITDESWGYGFDIAIATLAVTNASEGATVELPLGFLEPSVTRQELMDGLFKDVLGTYTSRFTSAANSNYNARLAASKVNGVIILPGETFSFNRTVGKRTEEGGYKTSASYLNGKTVQTVGGGVCHTSSDLYYVALLSGMTILERSEHAYVAPYVPVGLDATVSWGQLDMKFRNDTNYPVQILIDADYYNMTVTFMGTEERSHYVTLDSEITHIDKYETIIGPAPEDEKDSDGNPIVYEPGEVVTTGINGITAEAFINYIDRESGRRIARYSLGTSEYVRRDEYIVEEPEPPTEPTEPPTEPTEPPTQPTEPPTQPTESATEATTPSTEATQATDPSTSPSEGA